MEILSGTQRAVQSAQMPNLSPIDPQRPHPQHLHGLPTPGKDPLSRLHCSIIDSCFAFSLLHRASRSGGSRIRVTDDAPTPDSVVPDVCTPPSLLTDKITNAQFTHATTIQLRACQHRLPNDTDSRRHGL